MNAEKFWYGWLKVAAVTCTVWGLFVSLFNQTSILNFMHRFINDAFYTSGTVKEHSGSLQEWVLSSVGSVMAAWGIIMLFLIRYPLQKKEKWSWNAIMYSLIVWYIIDTFYSFYHGAGFSVVVNTILMLQFVAPLLVIKNTMVKVLK